ncbi:hypothetical protein [Streptomyces sp. NBC_00063]|uniref:hypothetical protein n=1 Tax=Streptomyces sp. NBC_00063 TaxID=2975638 RepID=UPI003D75C782
MSASVAVRSVRAAVFTALCVLLAAGGHVLATGEAPPVWLQVVLEERAVQQCASTGLCPALLRTRILGGLIDECRCAA